VTAQRHVRRHGRWLAGLLGFGHFLNCRSGANAVEFALVAPVMLILGMGTIELSAYLRADRAVSDLAGATTVAIGDLEVVTQKDIADLAKSIRAASGYLDTRRLQVFAESVTMSGGRPVRDWQAWVLRGNGVPSVPTEVHDKLATAALDNGESAMIVDVSYAYHDIVGGGFLADTIISRTFLAYPKNDEPVELE